MAKTVTFKAIDGIDFIVGVKVQNEIPTKQDKFKPLNGEFYIEENGIKTKLEEYEPYVKKKGKDNLKSFEAEFIEVIKEGLTNEHPFPRDTKLEVIISISMSEKRLKEVDIDNLIKSVLDCFTGLLFVDDSQVQNVLASKFVHELGGNSVLVGVRKLRDENDSWFKNIKLYTVEETEE